MPCNMSPHLVACTPESVACALLQSLLQVWLWLMLPTSRTVMSRVPNGLETAGHLRFEGLATENSYLFMLACLLPQKTASPVTRFNHVQCSMLCLCSTCLRQFQKQVGGKQANTTIASRLEGIPTRNKDKKHGRKV